MHGNEAILETLNSLLSDELSAINQYMVHAEMCDNWNYDGLHDTIEERAIAEMRHAEHLVERILFLEGRPIVSHLHDIKIGPDIEKQLANDLESELAAVAAYNAAVRLALGNGDNGTRELLESILTEEEAHVDWIEAQLDQIAQMGIQNYLAAQAA